ncbi:MAG: hypothetical protein ABSD59_12970 [Terracidiphilus sp.]|jgi:hypothetical protein
MSAERTKLDVSKASEEQKKEILRYAAEARRFEIERFWHRSLFFWGFISVAFVAYAQLSNNRSSVDLPFVIACFGIVCSVAWTLQNRGSKYWQEAWEQKVESVEDAVLGASLFHNHEPLQPKGFWGAGKFSVTKLAIALSDFTVLVWITLAVKSFPICCPSFEHVECIVAAAVTALFVGLLFFCRQSG